MMDRVVSKRSNAKASRNRAVRPVVEGLEGRFLLYAVTGDHFTFGSRITWSLVPDGTNLGGVTSNLQATLDRQIGPGKWWQAIEDAFAQWENFANVNFVQVGDDGAPTNSGNYQQSSNEFGDIRIGGYSGGFFQGSTSTLAYTLLPPKANGGSDSGDIFFNTNQTWNVNSGLDLESVAMHEVGHALGLDHSTSFYAQMYPYYKGPQQYLDQDDINGVRSIWGPRQEDGLAAGNSNFTSSKAASITPFINGANNQIWLPNQNVVSPDESYWFKVTTPANASNNLTVQVQSWWLSELSPDVTIFNSSLKGLARATAPTSAYGAVIAASISNATPNTTYYIRMEGSAGFANASGAYAMTVNMGNQSIAMSPPPNTTVYAQPDQGPGGVLEKRDDYGVHRSPKGDTAAPIATPTVSIPGITPPTPATTSSNSIAPTHISVPHPFSFARLKRQIVQAATEEGKLG